MTPDVNVLVAAARNDHPFHESARAWLVEAIASLKQGRPLVILPMVASGFLRVATHPKVFARPTEIVAALDFIAAVRGLAGVESLPLGSEWRVFDSLCREHQLAGNAIPDAWIAAAVLAHHEHLVTFDRGFRKYLSRTNLTVLAP